MEKTKWMLKYEDKIGVAVNNPIPPIGYVRWLETELEIATTRANALQDAFDRCEAKATAYDRLMSGGKKTLKEWANIFGSPFAVNRDGRGFAYSNIPECETAKCFGEWFCRSEWVGACVPKSLIDFTGDWKDSLTLPDGWEKK